MRKYLASLTVVAMLSSCTMFMKKAPAKYTWSLPATSKVPCSGYGLPALDLAIAVAGIAVMVLGLRNTYDPATNSYTGGSTADKLAAGAGALAFAANGTAGALGIGFAMDCSAYKRAPLVSAPEESTPTSTPTPTPTTDAGGCERDTDCKGDRICEQGVCVSPTAP